MDDGSPDRSGDIALDYAAWDPRIRVLRTANAGLGAARNTGTAAVDGDYLAYVDSDDVLPPTALADLVAQLEASGSDFACGSLMRWEAEPPAGRGLHEPRWMNRLHEPARTGIRIGEHPEMLGDVFAWNKLYRRSFWDEQRLSWPVGLRYEDQPTTTARVPGGPLRRARPHGSTTGASAATAPRSPSSAARSTDVIDRLATKRMSLDLVRAHGDPEVTRIFLDRVLPGDLWRYFEAIPGCRRSPGPPCCATASRSSGRDAPWCTPCCRRCTGCAAGWSSSGGWATRPG